MQTWLVTGGAGFIGSNFVLSRRERKRARIVTVDKLTYAGNAANLEPLGNDPDHVFIQADILDRERIRGILEEHRPDAIVHFAAESHVDRSILAPDTFVQTNILGTFALLEEARAWLDGEGSAKRETFRFLHVSTDEVYGALGPDDPPFTEQAPYRPNSPYAASKAAADHLVRAYCRTYGFPALIVNCSNNYGPYQHPEKLIPCMLLRALEGQPLPLYGDGMQVRDWLFAPDTCDAVEAVLERGRPGGTWNVGGGCERTNYSVVEELCGILDTLRPDHVPHRRLIAFVADRPGHDRRYALESGKIAREIGWKPSEPFARGLERTIRWYLGHPDWIASVRTGAYREWMEKNYAGRNPGSARTE